MCSPPTFQLDMSDARQMSENFVGFSYHTTCEISSNIVRTTSPRFRFATADLTLELFLQHNLQLAARIDFGF